MTLTFCILSFKIKAPSKNLSFLEASKKVKQEKEKPKEKDSTILQKIKKVPVYRYHYKSREYPELNLPEKEQIGVMAQDLQKQFPTLVQKHESGFLQVNYQGMIPVLWKAVQDLQKKNEELYQRIKSLEKKISKQNQNHRRKKRR